MENAEKNDSKRNSNTASGKKSSKKVESSGDLNADPSDSHSDEEKMVEIAKNQDVQEEVDESNETYDTRAKVKSKTTNEGVSSKKQSKQTSTGNSFPWGNALLIGAVLTVGLFWGSSWNTDSDSQKEDWRSKIDPDNRLSDEQQFIITASLKSIMDQTHREGVSTLLILSPKEKSAGEVAQCLLKFVNRKSRETKVPTEIDLKSHRGGKLRLDQDLQQLFKPGSDIQAVLLRHIDDNSSSDAFERARLLFAYCDGENPVVPHRLIIMTASSEALHESELRDRFKEYWPTEHDFVDALMSRISGHTLFVAKDQQSIC